MGNIMVKIMLYHMFFLPNDVVIASNKILEDLAQNGLATGQGERVFFSIKQILTFCGNLSEVRQLPTETPTHIFSGLELYSVVKFKQTFALLFNQERTQETRW